MAIRFSDFRWHREGASRPTATEEDSRVPAEAAQAIAAIRERLESQLPAILDDILPVLRERGWRCGAPSDASDRQVARFGVRSTMRL